MLQASSNIVLVFITSPILSPAHPVRIEEADAGMIQLICRGTDGTLFKGDVQRCVQGHL